MRWARRARQSGEARLIRWCAPIVPRLPRGVVLVLARLIGFLAYYLAHTDRRIAAANLAVAFGASLSRADRRRITLASFQHFSLLLLDVFWFSRDTVARVKAYFRPGDGWRFYRDTAPSIAVTGHIGNWEMLGLGTAVLGYPLTTVAMPLQNPYANEVINAIRGAVGMTIVPRTGAVRVLLRAMRDRKARVALLMDQNTPPHEGGAFEKFFGLEAPISLAIELLRRHTGAPVIVGWCVPDKRGVYYIHSLPPFPEDGVEMTPREVTLEVIARLERAIRQHPEFWLWSYRRWRLIPPDGDPARYPFYARPYRIRKERKR
jgi:Kdo2-lipid IVA lauroyltransferase/acyltransferase